MGGILEDIRSVDITKIDTAQVFGIDTNVLVWTHYSNASSSLLYKHPYQVVEYPNFVGKLLSNGNKIVTTTLNITELISVVEKNQYKIYSALNKSQKISFKDYRKNLDERQKYKDELDNMIMEIKSSYDDQIEVIDITDKSIEDFKKSIMTMQCDIFDFCIIGYLKSIGITNYISDDKDFLSIDGIKLFSTYDDNYYEILC